MAQYHYASPLRLLVTPRKNLRYYWLLLALIASLAIVLCELLWWHKLLLFFMLMLLLRNQWRSTELKALHWRDDNSWELEYISGQREEAFLLTPCFVHARWAVLRFRQVERKGVLSAVILPGTNHPEVNRRFRVRMKVTPPDQLGNWPAPE